MKTLLIGALALSLMSGASAMAQSGYRHDNRPAQVQNGNGQHRGWGQDRGAGYTWRRGQRMGYNDWASAQRIDYRSHKLRRPPRGYEWRQSNGQYVLGALATGMIISAMVGNR